MSPEDVYVVIREDTDGAEFCDWRFTANSPTVADFLWRAHVARSYMSVDERANLGDEGTHESEQTITMMPCTRIAHVQAEECEVERSREVGR